MRVQINISWFGKYVAFFIFHDTVFLTYPENHEPHFNSLFMKKLPFSQQITFFVLEIDPQNIFHYQCDINNYKDKVLNFHYIVDINLYTQNLPVYNSGQYIYVMGLCNFFFCFSGFDWQNQFLFSENIFSTLQVFLDENK